MRQKIKRNANSEDITIREAFDMYIDKKEGMYVVDKTILNYHNSLKKFLEVVKLKDTDLVKEVEESKIYQFINGCKLRDLAPASINHYLRDIRAWLYWCMDMEYLEPYKIKNIKAQEEKIKLYSEEDMEKLLEKPRPKDNYTIWRCWAITNWMFDNGNRAGTVCNIRLNDLNFTKHTISISYTKQKKAQELPMSSSLENCLKEYIRVWRADVYDGYLFCNVGEEKLTTDALKHSYKKYCQDREVECKGLHALRHTFAKNFILNNGNPMKLQKILGHSTLDMTKRYIRLFDTDLIADYDNYSPLDLMKKSSKRTQKVKRN